MAASCGGRARSTRSERAGASLGFVFQDPTLMPWARVEANVRLPLDLAGMPQGRERGRALTDALARVGLEGFAAIIRGSCPAA